jgi:hypothetical protein
MFSYTQSAFDIKLGVSQFGARSRAGAALWQRWTEHRNLRPGAINQSGCIPAQASKYDATSDVDMVVLYNQIQAIPSMIVEPFYVLYHNRLSERANPGQFSPKSSSQVRHMIGARVELRSGNWDFAQA